MVISMRIIFILLSVFVINGCYITNISKNELKVANQLNISHKLFLNSKVIKIREEYPIHTAVDSETSFFQKKDELHHTLIALIRDKRITVVEKKSEAEYYIDFEYIYKYSQKEFERGAFCTTTLGLLPSWATEQYTLRAKLFKKSSSELVRTFEYQADKTFICHLTLLPIGLIQEVFADDTHIILAKGISVQISNYLLHNRI